MMNLLKSATTDAPNCATFSAPCDLDSNGKAVATNCHTKFEDAGGSTESCANDWGCNYNGTTSVCYNRGSDVEEEVMVAKKTCDVCHALNTNAIPCKETKDCTDLYERANAGDCSPICSHQRKRSHNNLPKDGKYCTQGSGVEDVALTN